jgi:hypothetical protein
MRKPERMIAIRAEEEMTEILITNLPASQVHWSKHDHSELSA